MSQPPVTPDPFRTDDAAYLLGSLSSHDRARYEQHLATCEACTRSVAELAGLPGVLRRLPVDVVRALDDHAAPTGAAPTVAARAEPGDAGVPPSVLVRLLAEAEGESRRERRVRAVRWTSALTTAAAAVVVAALAWFGPFGGDPDGTASTAPAPTAQLVFEPLAGTDLSAAVSLRDVAWGTRIELECAHPGDATAGTDPTEGRYSLVVHDTGGASEQVATWNAVAGRELTIDAATALRGPDIDRLEVLAEDGTVVLRAAR